MLKSIYIDGFRHFKNFSLELNSQTTLLSGLNGTGKTSIVEIVNRLQLFLVNSLPVDSLCRTMDVPVWENKEWGHFSTTMGLDLGFGASTYSYAVEVRHNFKESICRVEKETLSVDGSKIFSNVSGNAEVVSDDNRSFSYPVDWTFTGLLVAGRNSSKIREFISLIRKSLYAVSLNPFAISSGHQEQDPLINLDGSNFSAWYDYLLGKQIAVVAGAFTELASFIPGFKQFIIEREGKSKELIADIFMGKSVAYRLPFENLSHGQKILCLLHLLVRICPEDSTVLIDEFENFLSPVELQPLYDAAEDAFEERNVQFLFVSHHHKTMNWFQGSAVILSFSGNPAFVRIEKFAPENGLSIAEHLRSKQAEGPDGL